MRKRGGGDDPMGILEKLKPLLDNGTLTQPPEFDAKKAELLARI